VVDVTTGKLQTAITNAQAAGRTEDVAFLTRELNRMREADPLSTVPTNLAGVDLSPEIREAIALGRTLEDPREKRLLAARISGRIASLSEVGGFADDVARSQFGTFIRSIGTGLFGIGDIAAAGATAVTTDLSFGESLEAQREFRRAQEEEFPITSGIGEIGGAIIGGGGAGVALRGAAAGTRAAGAVRGVTTLQAGQRGRNILRVAGAGAAEGAIAEEITEGRGERGALFGLAGGPVGLGLAKTLGIGVDAFRKRLARAGEVTTGQIRAFIRDPAARSIRVLAKKLDMPVEEVGRRFKEFEAVTGKKPSVADIANDTAAEELRILIQQSPGGTAIAREAAETTLRARPAEVAEQLTGGRVTTAPITQEAARGRVAARQFAEAAEDEIKFTGRQVTDLLLDADLRRGLPPSIRRRLDNAIDDQQVRGKGPVMLSGADVGDIRQALNRGRGREGTERVFGDLADEVEAIGRGQSEALGRAIDEFAGRSLRGEGVAEGARLVTAGGTAEAEAAARVIDQPSRLAGRRVGARTGLADVAREGVPQLRTTLERLTGETGLLTRLGTVLPERELAAIRRIAQVQRQSIRNIARIAPNAQPSRELRAAVGEGIDAIIAAAPGTSPAAKTFAFGRILNRITSGVPERVINNLARDAFDPAKTKAVLTVLRRQKLSEEQILDVFASAALGNEVLFGE